MAKESSPASVGSGHPRGAGPCTGSHQEEESGSVQTAGTLSPGGLDGTRGNTLVLEGHLGAGSCESWVGTEPEDRGLPETGPGGVAEMPTDRLHPEGGDGEVRPGSRLRASYANGHSHQHNLAFLVQPLPLFPLCWCTGRRPSPQITAAPAFLSQVQVQQEIVPLAWVPSNRLSL